MRRRDFLVGVSGFAGLAAAHAFLRPGRAAAAEPPRARACVLVWLNGGPSHVDTWDVKAKSKFKAVATRAPALTLSEHLPRLGEVAQHLAVIRGMTSKEGNHQRAQHFVHTGYAPNPTVSYPSFGGWVAAERAAGGPDASADLPAFVSINGASFSAGFLGVENNPFIVQNVRQPLANTDYADGVNMVRFLKRKQALEALDDDFARVTGDAKIKGRRAVYARAIRMMYAPRLKAFDLSDESDATVRAYGASDFGKGCLMARRLVEAGVRFVEVTLDGWDTHKDVFGKTEKLMGVLDPAMAALIGDLEERRLLSSTLVLCMGEFGRTPKLNADEGRDHHPAAWSAVLAGGGVRGGVALGRTDDDGDKVVERPTSVPELWATAATLMGMDPDKQLTTPLGRPVSLTDKGKPIRELIASG